MMKPYARSNEETERFLDDAYERYRKNEAMRLVAAAEAASPAPNPVPDSVRTRHAGHLASSAELYALLDKPPLPPWIGERVPASPGDSGRAELFVLVRIVL